MELVKFSVTNFRSISKAHNVPIAHTTVLVGKNNEGKSNILRALATAMQAIELHAKRQRFVTRPVSSARLKRFSEDRYNWDRDFPISIQNRRGKKLTSFTLEFELTEDEIEEFKKEIKSNFNGTLPLKIVIGDNNQPEIKVVKRGPGSKTLNSRSNKITDYIAKRISFNYIPAIRTHEQTLSVIDELLSRELFALEENEDYQKAMEVISSIEQPVLDKLSEKIKAPLSEFLPNIKHVKININDDSRRIRYRRDFDVIVDDGTPTSIEFKGDGVKSLAALGLLKNKSNRSGVSIIAIEEPESHLHSGAIHQLAEIINSLESENQIVLTTHNPLFVNRSSVQSNIIVDNGKATQAKNIQLIREILGVRVSDNLVNARYTLIVEGKGDRIALEAILPCLSSKLSTALKNNLLIIDSIGGSGGLPYKLASMENQLCLHHVLLDFDKAGNTARDKATKQKVLHHKNLTQTICAGMAESEFEDCLDSAVYKQAIIDEHAVDINCIEFRGNKKWSERVKKVFLAKGKAWTDSIEAQVKNTVSTCVVRNPSNALCSHKRSSIDALVKELEKLISNQ